MKGIIAIMNTKKQLVSKAKADVTTVKPKRDAHRRPRAEVMADICEILAMSESLDYACRQVQDAPHPATVLDWVEKYPELGQQYASARVKGYTLLGDKIQQIASETHAIISVQELDPDGRPLFNTDGTPLLKQVLAPLSADVMASKRLQVDTLKWKLSKMLPKVYGDKTTTELTGAGGGPVQVAALSLNGLSDTELEAMERLLSKASAARGSGA